MQFIDFTLVDNELFGDSCWGFVLISLILSSHCSQPEIFLRVF